VVVRNFGYFKPNLVLGSCIATVGCGLVYTLDLDSSAGHWIGYQIVVGVGVGMALQQSLIATQATVHPSDLAPATAMVLCKSLLFRLS